MSRLWQYQVKAEPLVPIASATEVITLDKWYAQASNPRWSKRGIITAAVPFLAFVNLGQPEIVHSETFSQPRIEPRRAVPRPVRQEPPFIAPAATPSTQVGTEWIFVAPDPIRRSRWSPAVNGKFVNCFDANGIRETNVADWMPSSAFPVKRRAIQQPGILYSETPTASPGEITVDRWEPRGYCPRWSRLNRVAFFPWEFRFSEPIATPVFVELDRWEPRLSQPYPHRKKPASVGWSAFQLVITQAAEVQLDRWAQPVSQPIRRPALRSVAPLASFTRFGITIPPIVYVFDPDVVDQWTIPGGGAGWSIPPDS